VGKVRRNACGQGASLETRETVARRRSTSPTVVGTAASRAEPPARLADVGEASSVALSSGGL
jgi:hypothetical protein